MGARYKDFGSPVTASSDEPVMFSLYGEQFRCLPAMQGTKLIEFIAMSGDPDNPSGGATAVLEFFKTAISSDDFPRFEAITNSDDRIVPMETLSEIMDWLITQYAARPTQPPMLSEPGQPTTGTMFAGVPSSPPAYASAS
jgi:hypothetical protein